MDYYPTHLIFVVHSFFCTALVLYTYLVVFFVLCTLCTHYTLLVSVLYTASHGISHSFPHNTQHLWLVIVGSLHHSAWLLYQSIHTVYSTQHRPLSGTLHKVYYLFTQRLSHNWPQARWCSFGLNWPLAKWSIRTFGPMHQKLLNRVVHKNSQKYFYVSKNSEKYLWGAQKLAKMFQKLAKISEIGENRPVLALFWPILGHFGAITGP